MALLAGITANNAVQGKLNKLKDFIIKSTPTILALFWLLYITTSFHVFDKTFLIMVVATGYILSIWLTMLFEKYK